MNNNLRTLTRTASALGVTLPESVAEILSASHGFPALADVERETVEAIASAVGRRDFPKVRDAALDSLARATAASRIRRPLDEALDRARWTAVVMHADEIAEAFRSALADDVEVLNAAAPLVPTTATASSTDLSPDAYRARMDATVAADRLVSASSALAPLYGVSNGPGIRRADVSRRIMWTALPEDLDRETGLAIARGLTGSRLVRRGGDPTETAALWWVIAAAHGCTFRLLDVEEYRVTLALLVEAGRAPALGEVLPASLVSGLVL